MRTYAGTAAQDSERLAHARHSLRRTETQE
jgi:hypothetical protein